MATARTATPTPTPGGKQQNIFLDMIPLGRLSFGHDIKGGGVNARKAGRDDVATLAKSIREMGLIVPLTVVARDDRYYVADGNRRLAALLSIYKTAADRDAMPVPCYYGAGSGANALEISLVANAERVDLHPVDRFEVFAELVRTGDPVEKIAARYMLKVPQVRQALALARMAPEVRAAWRAGDIEGEAAEAYAQTQDHEHQVRVLKKLKSNAGNAWQVNREIVGDHNDVGRLLKVVGEAAYEKAGHQVNHSLFDDDDRGRVSITVTNVPALKTMASALISDKIAGLLADGWGWAIEADKKPPDIHAWRRLPSTTPTKEQKAAAGCTVGINHAGAIEVNRGYIKPGTSIKIPKSPAEKKAAAVKATKAKDETGGISGSLAERLSSSITRAAAEALEQDPSLALRVAIAALAAGTSTSPAKIEANGFSELTPDQDDDRPGFGEYLKFTAKKSPGELLKMLAGHVARSLNMVCAHAGSLPLTGEHAGDDAMLLEAIDGADLNKAMRKHFDAADYFNSVAGPIIRDAIKEMGGLAPAGGAKKAELVATAAMLQQAKAWLPVELRVTTYDGPKAPAAPKAKASKKPRAKK